MEPPKRNNPFFSGYFYSSVAVLLLITGAIKAAGIAHGFRGMKAANSVIPFFSNLQIIFLSAVIEFAAGCVLILAHDFYLRRLVVYWMASLFLAYRLGLVIVGDYSGCGCLGVSGRSKGTGSGRKWSLLDDSRFPILRRR